MARNFAVDEILRSLSHEDAWEFERMVYGPGKPRLDKLQQFLATKGHRATPAAIGRWYAANRDRYQVVPPDMALHRTLTGAAARRDRLQAILDRNWPGIETALNNGLSGGENSVKTALKLLEAIAALDLGVRVAAQQMHDLEVRIEQEKLVMATIHQVFSYLHLEMERQGVDSLRAEALEPMLNAVSDRIALENKFQKHAADLS